LRQSHLSSWTRSFAVIRAHKRSTLWQFVPK
jgi:hypothetical protein